MQETLSPSLCQCFLEHPDVLATRSFTEGRNELQTATLAQGAIATETVRRGPSHTPNPGNATWGPREEQDSDGAYTKVASDSVRMHLPVEALAVIQGPRIKFISASKLW